MGFAIAARDVFTGRFIVQEMTDGIVFLSENCNN